MAALAAAILIGLQLSADYWAFLYLAWIVPLVGLSLLADRGAAAELVDAGRIRSRAPSPAPVDGWMSASVAGAPRDAGPKLDGFDGLRALGGAERRQLPRGAVERSSRTPAWLAPLLWELRAASRSSS